MSTLPPNQNGIWRKNERSRPDDWTCSHCFKHNPLSATECMLCGRPATIPEPMRAANSNMMLAKAMKASGAGPHICVRNRTNSTLWFYTEQTAPIHWVQLRPGEACDIPTIGAAGNKYTIGASIDEPNPGYVIGKQFAIAFGILAFPVLVALPDPASKIALVAYITGALSAAGAMAGESILLAVSNQSNLKQVGVDALHDVWELTADLDHYVRDASGQKVGVYSYHWTQVPGNDSQRFNGWTKVEHGKDRGDLEDLPPLNSKVLDEIRHHSEIGTLYFDAVEYWKKEGTLAEHKYPFGGKGGSESSTIFGHRTPAGNNTEYGLITEARVSACKFIDAIQVKYNHRQEWERVTGAGDARGMKIFSDSKSTDHGGYGGYFKCNEGEYISKIIVKHDKYIVSLQFITNRENKSRVFGGRDGDGDKTTTISQNGANIKNADFGWIGYECSYMRWMDSMTFLMGKKEQPAK